MWGMRGGGAFLAALGTLAFLGCGSGTGSEDAVPFSAPAAKALEATRSYENGHPLAQPTADAVVLAYETEVVRLVNDHRVSRGLNALVDSGALREVARAHSHHMIVHRFTAHTNPEGLGVAERFTQSGLAWSTAGENLAAGPASPLDAFNAWMASPGHKENIEREGWTHVGVGYAADPSPTDAYPNVHYWTQNFLKP